MRQPSSPQDIIDVADGLERVMGDRDQYGRMLRRFRDDHPGGALPIRQAFERGELAQAQHLAHTLKGSAGMIGARALHAQATVTEQALRTGAPDQREHILALAPEFDKVMQLLDSLLPDRTVAPETAPHVLLEDPALLTRLVELLRSGDGAAVDLVEEHGASLAAILGESGREQVAAAVNDFDFAAALKALRQ
jgi:HPt (histidine-containing phosphotransfer) domain-containing protein